ncbi:imidazolonepropionase [Hoeflea poritis]|uniref:Imidazolonepropionase n=1 Tax=Hoeflea poritis TaxID=2993659 RepID=A0ABT4VWF6_9HYPH|nr:imidazolonepropionase [Hoeflea poritis]MDA4848550.1 imidazolonepropionase [Hoeflea poritis]
MEDVRLITNVSAATMIGPDGVGLVPQAGIVIRGGRIAWVGAITELPKEFQEIPAVSYDGRLATPALVDCHTHLVHGGNRAREFEMRLEGASYEEIARAGGGIVSTVSATREAGEKDLLSQGLRRVDALIAEGVATVEIKSGYGLEPETELKMLRVARRIAQERPINVKTTYLGAHASPKGIDPDTYIDTICIPTLDAAHVENLVDAVDGFCESIAFNPDQISRVFDHAKSLGLPVKLHAEQLGHLGGTALAARYGALSVDHVEYATEADARALADAGSVAVLLPGAFYTLKETQKPPIDAFRRHDVPMAVATDWNPGSSPMGSVLLAMNMCCTLFGLTPSEALAGTTLNAAHALGLEDRGVIAEGMRADLAIWDVEDMAELSYLIGANPLHSRIFAGAL